MSDPLKLCRSCGGQIIGSTHPHLCAECAIGQLDSLFGDEATRTNIVLLTPRWSEAIMTDPRPEPLCAFELDGPDWFLTLRIDDRLYSLPVREGEPLGDIIDVMPGVKAWGAMERYGLSRLGPGVWRMEPSLMAPELHAFIVVRDVPEPAPFVRPVLFSAAGLPMRLLSQ